MTLTRNRAAGALAVSTIAALMLSACGSGVPGSGEGIMASASPTAESPQPSSTPTPSASPTAIGGHQPVTITIGTWGYFGIAEDAAGPSLERVYEAEHPWVDIVVESGDYGATHDLLSQALLAGSGAYTISAIDEDFIVQFVARSDDFVNLLDLGAGQYQDRYLPWKWDQATTADGSAVIGLGYDVGGMALCYRKDLFEAAGLPSDRDDVSAILGDSWEDFIAVGEAYVDATGRAFVDNAVNVLYPTIVQLGTGYGFYDRNNQLDMDNIRPAFEIAIDIIDSGLSSGIYAWSPEWNAGFANGDFAVLACPSWMLGYIQSQASGGEFAGQWDIADLPGPGGNWGGSFFAIPKQGTEYTQQEAYAFIEWLIQPEQQIKMMEETGNLPSQISILASNEFAGYTQPFFNDAPYAEIFAKSVLDIPAAIYHAPNERAVRIAVEYVLYDVQAGNIRLVDAWEAAVEAAEAADR